MSSASLGLVALALLVGACATRPAPAPMPLSIDGHHDVVLDARGAHPLVLGARTIRLCVAVDPGDELGDWQLRLDSNGREGEWQQSSRRLFDPGQRFATVCFEHSFPETEKLVEHELCGVVRRVPDSAPRPIACHQVVHRPADPSVSDIFGRMTADGGAVLALADELDDLGYPLQALRMRLNGLHFLAGELGPEDFRGRASAVLEAAPPWLARYESITAYWMGIVATRRGRIELETDRMQPAWVAFGEAQRRFAKIASPIWPMATFRRAEVLERIGAYDEASRLADEALDICQPDKFCSPVAVDSLRFQRAWLRTIDEDATDGELREAIATFEAQGRNPSDPLFEAESLINIALATQRLGEDPMPWLASARERLVHSDENPRRRDLLTAWGELIAAQEATPRETAARALAVAERAVNPQLAALAYDRAGWAEFLAGRLSVASEHYDRALDLFRISSPTRLSHEVPLGTGDGAQTVFRAARVALDRGAPKTAWRLLEELDAQSRFELRRRRCRAMAAGAGAEAWHRLDEELRGLADRLLVLARPAPGAERARRRQQYSDARRQVRALSRELPGCQSDEGAGRLLLEIPADGVDRGIRPGRDIRAFALDDEIVVLRATGEDVVTYRTPLPRRTLLPTTAEIARALARADVPDPEWRKLLSPVAEALVPAVRDVGVSHVRVALHGTLQGVPLDALPLAGGRWLADEVTTIIIPADVQTGTDRGRAAIGSTRSEYRPLLVINPTGELRINTRYRALVPGAEILEGSAATFLAVSQSAEEADWLHIDTHGYYDPAFADLSYLALSDTRLGLADMRALDPKLRFANLSGCETGRWPETPDSGRYGIGGVLAAGEVDRVIASRAVIGNDLADRFNTHFYTALEDDVDAAFSRALEMLRAEGVPASAWGALMLIAGNGESPE